MSNPKYKLGGTIWKSVFRISASLITGCIFYTGWLGIFLLLYKESNILETSLRITAPIFTGLGFGLGVHLLEKVLKEDPTPFHQIALWPILGCILGAVAVYWGPMLIVFSMLVAGTTSIFLREFIHYRRRQV